ncbi:MAG: metallophosphoesterase family protein [Gemmatimonadetes bacterium]|nr:metallophosphoesterase family protein [Gemmatimonadota bacterium]
MRLAILSDIHANVEALGAVLRDMHRGRINHAVCLGDLVGYNALPRETIKLVRDRGIVSIHGNHDLMTIGRLATDSCGPRARKAIAWTRTVLTSEEHAYLASLPGKLRHEDSMLFVHATLSDPVTRIRAEPEFREQHQVLQRRYPRLQICFTGHTHERAVVEITARGEFLSHKVDEIQLGQDSFYFINPGSVGEPRGRDERAAYAVFDFENRTVTFRRAGYDRKKVLRENARQGLAGEPVAAGGSLGARAVAAAKSVTARLLAGRV